MVTRLFAIELTKAEAAIVGLLEFDALAVREGSTAVLANMDLTHRLIHSLLEREGNPAQRLRYFTDPDYHPGGRGTSRKNISEQNGTKGDAILRHPHFLKYLRYFVLGADLPDAVFRAYSQAVEDCRPVISGDIAQLSSTARQLVRTHRLNPKAAADAFYKLCLDLGLSSDQAGSIRSSVLQVKPAR
jgi:hypothetical protein